jgi:hypothetical protein
MSAHVPVDTSSYVFFFFRKVVLTCMSISMDVTNRIPSVPRSFLNGPARTAHQYLVDPQIYAMNNHLG